MAGGNIIASNLPGGIYSITVTDSENCQAILPSISIIEPGVLDISVNSTTDANCNLCDGTATISVFGGNGNFVYTWSNGETTANPVNLCPGITYVTVTDNRKR